VYSLMRSRQIQAYLSQEELLREKAVWKPGFPGPWQHAGWTYDPATGLWSANPVAGAELVTNGNMETGDPPTGWNVTAPSTIDGVAEERTGGSGAQSIDVVFHTGGSYYSWRLDGNPPVVINQWYKISYWQKTLQGAGRARLYWSINAATLFPHANPADWTQYTGTTRATKTGAGYLYLDVSTTDGDNTRYDDVSVKPLTLSELLCIRNYGRQVGLKAPATKAAGFQVGIVVRYSNINNFLLAYHDRTNAYLVKYVDGEATQLIGAAAAYADGRYLEVRWNGADTAQLYYNDVQIGTDQDVSSVPAGTWGGMFSTGSASDGCYVGTPTVV